MSQSQELTTRDVFQQVDTRLGRVEEDVRGLRAEMNARFAALSGEMNSRFTEMDARIGRNTALLVSVAIGLVASWASLMASIWLR